MYPRDGGILAGLSNVLASQLCLIMALSACAATWRWHNGAHFTGITRRPVAAGVHREHARLPQAGTRSNAGAPGENNR